MVNFERWNFFTGEIGGENIGEGIGKFLIFKRKKKKMDRNSLKTHGWKIVFSRALVGYCTYEASYGLWFILGICHL